MTFGIAEKTYSILIDTLDHSSEVDEAILFGSRALGNYRPGSDIDIAIKGRFLSVKTAIELSSRLNEKMPLPYLFDIVHYATINNPELKTHIDQFGVIIFSRQNS